jgi:hypothetical protein
VNCYVQPNSDIDQFACIIPAYIQHCFGVSVSLYVRRPHGVCNRMNDGSAYYLSDQSKKAFDALDEFAVLAFCGIPLCDFIPCAYCGIA